MTTIWVNYMFEGFHRWETAPTHRQYLRSRHRHLFYVRAEIQVFENDREIEFHDFIDFCKEHLNDVPYLANSCEHMAHHLLDAIIKKHPDRWVKVSVSEDNEVGATVVTEFYQYQNQT